MPAQARDAPVKTITKVKLARERFVLVARNIANDIALPFDANRIRVMDVVRFTYQTQNIANVHTGKKALAIMVLKAGNEGRLHQYARATDLVGMRKCEPCR